ncbi:MAG: galactose-1-phosphate uridylyltransferase [Patescibacteria group bacterium]
MDKKPAPSRIGSSGAGFPSELRFDPVSRDWVVIATGRAKRPEMFKDESRKKENAPKEDCPFCKMSKQEKPALIISGGKKAVIGDKLPDDWSVVVIPNKYPAFCKSDSLNARSDGPYQIMDSVGFHEVVITRDHEKKLANLSLEQMKEVIDAYQDRYLVLKKNKFVSYILIFHNSSREAGASIAHPHSQIIAIPFIDPDLHSSINGSRVYFQTHEECVHCVMLDWDRKDGRRIVFENEDFVVLIPFASRIAFETRVYPKKHQVHFEDITDNQKKFFAEALKVALEKLYKGLDDPPYNFFIHTAPCDGRDYGHYHWHLEIFPKTSTWAGFELGAGIEISTIEPEAAAEYLRKQK